MSFCYVQNNAMVCKGCVGIFFLPFPSRARLQERGDRAKQMFLLLHITPEFLISNHQRYSCKYFCYDELQLRVHWREDN